MIVDEIERAMQRRGLLPRGLAELSGQHEQSLRCNVLSRRHPPRHDLVVELLAVLGVEIDSADRIGRRSRSSPLFVRELIAQHITDFHFTQTEAAYHAGVSRPTLNAFLSRGQNAGWALVEKMLAWMGARIVWPEVSSQERIKSRRISTPPKKRPPRKGLNTAGRRR